MATRRRTPVRRITKKTTRKKTTKKAAKKTTRKVSDAVKVKRLKAELERVKKKVRAAVR